MPKAPSSGKKHQSTRRRNLRQRRKRRGKDEALPRMNGSKDENSVGGKRKAGFSESGTTIGLS